MCALALMTIRRAGPSFVSLGLQTFELEVFQMLVVVLFESSRGGVLVHLASAS